MASTDIAGSQVTVMSVRDEGCALRPLGLSRASIGRDTAARYRSARVTVTAGSRGSRVDGETGEAVQPAGTGPPAADAGPPAAEPERASAAEPSWVARAVWRGIWQLIAAVLPTVAGLWSCGSQRAGVGVQLAGVDAGGRERHQLPAAARGCCAGGGGQLAGAVFGLLTVGLFTFYLTANGPQVRRALRSRMPPERQQRVLWAWWNLSSPASRSRSHPNGSH